MLSVCTTAVSSYGFVAPVVRTTTATTMKLFCAFGSKVVVWCCVFLVLCLAREFHRFSYVVVKHRYHLCGSSMNYMWQLEQYLADLLRHYGLVEMAMIFYHRYLQDLSAVYALDDSGRRELIGAVEQQWVLLNWRANPTGRMQSFFGDVDREMERRRLKWKGEQWKWE